MTTGSRAEPDTAIDPVCGMPVDLARAVAASMDGALVLFCSRGCRDEFRSVRDHDATAAAPTGIAGLLGDPRAVRSVFQPIVRAASGEVAGYEALARFATEPSRSAEEWFDMAALAGRSAELEAAAMASALATIDRRPPPDATFVSINLAPVLLLAPAIRAVLADDRVPAERVVLELTERERVADYDDLRWVLAAYRGRGFRIAVDDAGAGYASMRHIAELLPDFIKLDHSLVRGLAHDRARRALLAAMATFAAELGSTLIAEGVEHEDELRVVAEVAGSILVQGFATGRPADGWFGTDARAGMARG